MGAIFRREMNAFFTSPIAYVYFAVFNVFAGIFFFSYCIAAGTTDMSGIFINMFTILLFLIPVLTMKLLSEERKQKTDQCLLTSPVSLTGIVLGKYFAALCVFAISLITFLVYALVISAYAPLNWTVIAGNIVGLFLLGAAFISIGLFISGLTENQILAVIGTFVVLMLIFFSYLFVDSINNTLIKKIITAISFQSRYEKFTTGVFSITGMLFFVSVAVIFNFLAIRTLERRRWA
ncbi:MAG TPA: ABC transporter permease [Oscillospiraceae bacterium]|nr:ABC transporter permease [Oscillospiraceae bacterium]